MDRQSYKAIAFMYNIFRDGGTQNGELQLTAFFEVYKGMFMNT
jgi:hypothetical protein